MPGRDNYCGSLCFSTNCKYLVSGWENSVVEIRSINDEGACTRTHELRGHQKEVFGVKVSNNDCFVASCSDDRTVNIWAFPAGNCLRTFQRDDGLTAVAISPDSRLVVVTSLDTCAYVWNVATGELLVTLAGGGDLLSGVNFMEKGKGIVISGHHNDIMKWDITKQFDDLDPGIIITPNQTFRGHSVSKLIFGRNSLTGYRTMFCVLHRCMKIDG